MNTAIKYLDKVIDINFYPIEMARKSNHRWRPVGLGSMGLQDVFFKLRIPFDSPEALRLSREIQEEIYYQALSTSCELAKKAEPHLSFKETRAARGQLQFDLWGVSPQNVDRWNQLKKKIQKNGLRNSLLIAIAPTATIASIVGCYEAIEPQITNLFKRETLSGEFLQINQYLIKELKKLNLWNPTMANKIKEANGSIQNIEEISGEIRHLFRTVWELPMRNLIDMAAARGPFIDQSQSLNLFIDSPTIGKLSSMYMYAWKKGLKTTYYLRSRPATDIAKTTVAQKSTQATSQAQTSQAIQTSQATQAASQVTQTGASSATTTLEATQATQPSHDTTTTQTQTLTTTLTPTTPPTTPPLYGGNPQGGNNMEQAQNKNNNNNNFCDLENPEYCESCQ